MIILLFWPEGTLAPIILFHHPGQTTYTILPRTGARRWAQFSYQFAQEFCHLVSGYECLEGGANSWFHESICEMAALFTLRSIGMTWKTELGSNADYLTQYTHET